MDETFEVRIEEAGGEATAVCEVSGSFDLGFPGELWVIHEAHYIVKGPARTPRNPGSPRNRSTPRSPKAIPPP